MFVFFNSSGIYLPVPRWSTSLPCLLVSQDSPAQCLISLPWWVRHPLPPTNMRAMKTLLDVKPYVSAGPMTELHRAERSLLRRRWESTEAPRFLWWRKERPGIFRLKGTANHCTWGWPRTPAPLPWSPSHHVPATHPFQSLSWSHSFHSLARTLLSLFLLKFLIIHVFIFPDEI